MYDVGAMEHRYGESQFTVLKSTTFSCVKKSTLRVPFSFDL